VLIPAQKLFSHVVILQSPTMTFLNGLLNCLQALLSARVLVLGISIYVVGLLIYRLFFSPIAGFPGPKLAAATQWYEFYWNVVKEGQFTLHLQDLHDKYGEGNFLIAEPN
jgi:hypothetical protein